ncbi:MAG: enoyl-CoA hydratase [Chloroflexi bacterium]|nr:enoyl-CoA hydratase [Chloroflexota bacterium]
MEEYQYRDIIYTKEDGIATITMNRPERLNAHSPDMVEGLYRALVDANQDPDIRVVVLTGTGRAFCAGADVKGMREEHVAGVRPRTGIYQAHSVFGAIRALDKPSIAAINGVAAGAGFETITHCDFRIASDQAWFKESAMGIGLSAGGGSVWTLPRLVGLPKALELLFLEERFDANEALRIGLVNKVVPHAQLSDEVRAWAAKLAKKPPLAVRWTKRAIYRGLEQSIDATFDYLKVTVDLSRSTDDHKEGAKAFTEKRPPVFSGR